MSASDKARGVWVRFEPGGPIWIREDLLPGSGAVWCERVDGGATERHWAEVNAENASLKNDLEKLKGVIDQWHNEDTRHRQVLGMEVGAPVGRALRSNLELEELAARLRGERDGLKKEKVEGFGAVVWRDRYQQLEQEHEQLTRMFAKLALKSGGEK